ncbi:DUF1517 domain-containing protein [Chroococcus sp. FPU101]|uniref:DUF1517 domain-containing protein n=1 Tax=Chroococcus sp. FPU101 TaxID=1974212 RepID=UPI001A8CDD03|nr:DUF1517 domain-containing protein [Chroococcus sp. FPU101]GFE71298.1 protein of unknown function DUF1517 [Chroococcus sp. FPU101]
MFNELLFKLRSVIKPLIKPLVAAGLLISLVLGHPSQSLAAGTGGRIGGGGFRAPRMAPSTRIAPPSRTYQPVPGGGYGYGYGYGGGGFGFPFLIPIGFGGFGSLFSILIFFAIAGFIIRTIQNVGAANNDGYMTTSSPYNVSVAKVQVGLLSSARYLQKELNQIAETADTGTASGRAELLQESTLALLRHPEYWVYGSTESQQAALNSAEAKFNQWSLAERSKYRAETLSNVNNQLKGASHPALNASGGELVPVDDDNGEYIVATIVVGVDGRLELPKVNDSQDLQQVVRQLGSIGSDRLLAVEILWSPQADGDALTKDDIIAQYPNLTLV